MTTNNIYGCLASFTIRRGTNGAFRAVAAHLLCDGLLFPSRTTAETGEPPPALVGYLFMGIGAGPVLCNLRFCRRSMHPFTQILLVRVHHGVFSVCLLPFGTVLGVFTFVVLSRPAVKQLFGIAVGELPQTI